MIKKILKRYCLRKNGILDLDFCQPKTDVVTTQNSGTFPDEEEDNGK
jgi:hypothetical protein